MLIPGLREGVWPSLDCREKKKTVAVRHLKGTREFKALEDRHWIPSLHSKGPIKMGWMQSLSTQFLTTDHPHLGRQRSPSSVGFCPVRRPSHNLEAALNFLFLLKLNSKTWGGVGKEPHFKLHPNNKFQGMFRMSAVGFGLVLLVWTSEHTGCICPPATRSPS